MQHPTTVGADAERTDQSSPAAFAPSKPRLLIFEKSRFWKPFNADQLRWTPYSALMPHCASIDLIAVSNLRQGHVDEVGNLRIHAAPYLRGPLGHGLYGLYAIATALRLRRHRQFDAVWAEDPLAGGLAAWGVARLFRRPLVIAVRTDLLNLSRKDWPWLTRTVQEHLTRWLTRRADRVRVVFRRLGRDLEAVGVAPSRIVYLPSPTDLSRFERRHHAQHRAAYRQRLGWSADDLGLLYIGRLYPVKGLDLLIEALAQVHPEQPQLKLAIVGAGPLAEELQALAHRHRLQEAVRFTGAVGHTEVPAHLAAADAMVLTSREEGLPRAAVEAAAMELPLIITDVGGSGEVVRNGHSGYLVQPEVADIAHALRRFAQLAPADRGRMGRASRALVQQGPFTIERNTELVVAELLWDGRPHGG